MVCELLHQGDGEGSSASVIRMTVPGMETVVATITGYVEHERSNLIKLINSCGSLYVGNLKKGSATHLVCWTFDGKKYKLAKKFGIWIVNHRWFEDSVKARRRLDEAPYTSLSGKDVGAMLWKAPSVPQPVKQGSLQTYTLDYGNPSLPRKRPLALQWTRSEETIECSDDEDLEILLHHRRKKKASKYRDKRNKIILDYFYVADDVDDANIISTSSSHYNNAKNGTSVENTHIHEDILASARVNCSVDAVCSLSEVDTHLIPSACTLVPSDIECVICHTDKITIAEGVLACGHRFCFQCIKKWASREASRTPMCPLCMAPFDVITKRQQEVGVDEGRPFHDESIVLLKCGEKCTSEQLGASTPNPSCVFCGIGDTSELLLICNGCGARAAHTFCLDPPLPPIPNTPWFCGRCSQRRRADTTWWYQLHAFDGARIHE